MIHELDEINFTYFNYPLVKTELPMFNPLHKKVNYYILGWLTLLYCFIFVSFNE